MLIKHEHRQVLSQALRTSGDLASSHRTALAAERQNWARERQRFSHHAVIGLERQRLRAARNEHKVALEQNRWLVSLADRLAASMRAEEKRRAA